MNYLQTIDYLYSRLPMYQRDGSKAFKKDLTNTLALCQQLDNPHQKFKSVHIAGTNGKGSSAHMIASILQTAGYKVGLYTSPHLHSFTERIRINGIPIGKEEVADFVSRIKPAIEQVEPSFFEITVAMAFDYFAQSKVDIAIIEVGLGGRLDSTNVITPLVSLITNISYDHKDMLGESLEEIAAEKAGIIKPSVPVVIGQKQEEIAHVFQQKAVENHSEMFFASAEWQLSGGPTSYLVERAADARKLELALPISADYMALNLLGVIMVIELLGKVGFPVNDDQTITGIGKVFTNTGLKGRWQELGDKPKIVCDIGHNEAGIQSVLRNLKTYDFNRLHIVWGMVKEKETGNILALLPRNASYYFCTPKIPRALEAELLSIEAEKQGIDDRQVVDDVNDAIQAAKENADEADLIFIGGSTFVVAEIKGL